MYERHHKVPGGLRGPDAQFACDVTVPEVAATSAKAIDVINGVEQELDFSVEDGANVLRRIMIKDYPVLRQLATR